MKRVLTILLATLLFPVVGNSADTVLAYRPSIAVTGVSPWHSLPLDTYTNATAWAIDGDLKDYSPARTDIEVVDSSCVVVALTDILTSTDTIPSGATITNGGTAVLAISGDTITCTTAGTAWNIQIFDGATLWAQLPCAEGSGAQLENVIDPDNPFAITTTDLATFRGGKTDAYHRNPKFGGSRVLSFDGSATSSALTGIYPNSTCTWKIIVRVKAGQLRKHIFGCTHGSNRRFYLIVSSTSTWQVGYGNSSVASSIVTDDKWHVIEFRSDKKVYLDNNQILNYSPSTFSGTGPIEIGISTILNEPTITNPAICDIKELEITCNGVATTYFSKNAYDNGTNIIIPDSSGNGNDATGTNVALPIYPALADGTDDTAGLGITNPGGLVHNNGGYSLSNSVLGVVTYVDMITNGVPGLIATQDTNGLIEEIYYIAP